MIHNTFSMNIRSDEMRFLRFLFFLVVVALIAGGAFYANQMGWSWQNVAMYFGNMNGMGAQNQHQQHEGMSSQMATSPFNTLAAQNRDKLVQANTSLSQAIDLITTDPYSQITQPHKAGETARGSVPQGNVNVTPKEGVTINIDQGGSQVQSQDDLAAQPNVVFDQSKLEQLHNGIFKFSQAMMLLQELNNDLADQSIMAEGNMPNEQTYVIRYNLTLQNRSKINQAGRLLQEAMILVNVNPYAPSSGYIYNVPKMQQLHQGIAELAKSALVLNRLAEDFSQQMTQITYEARMARAQPMQGMQAGGMGTMSMDSGWITTVAMIVVAFGIVMGVLIMIKRLVSEFKSSQ